MESIVPKPCWLVKVQSSTFDPITDNTGVDDMFHNLAMCASEEYRSVIARAVSVTKVKVGNVRKYL